MISRPTGLTGLISLILLDTPRNKALSFVFNPQHQVEKQLLSLPSQAARTGRLVGSFPLMDKRTQSDRNRYPGKKKRTKSMKWSQYSVLSGLRVLLRYLSAVAVVFYPVRSVCMGRSIRVECSRTSGRCLTIKRAEGEGERKYRQGSRGAGLDT
ncbi:hypothetical protein K440DRAFT_621187 [Wilcoxina mikolae CBS 423.85]|nr:hypothetical protein K440DRAFT_621187 [Wilcoxina mikolae CBS 423.85]